MIASSMTPMFMEADANFTPDLFDNTYLNMELAIPIDGDGPDFVKVTKSLREITVCQSAEPTII